VLGRQVVYHLNNVSSPFCFRYFFFFFVVLRFELRAYILKPLHQPSLVKGFFEIESHKLFAHAGFKP
jgi:hypothetical protein